MPTYSQALNNVLHGVARRYSMPGAMQSVFLSHDVRHTLLVHTTDNDVLVLVAHAGMTCSWPATPCAFMSRALCLEWGMQQWCTTSPTQRFWAAAARPMHTCWMPPTRKSSCACRFFSCRKDKGHFAIQCCEGHDTGFWFPRYLILATSSPHYGRGRGKPVAVYKIMIQNMLAYLRQHFKGNRVYIRSTIAGHPNCKHAQGPYSDLIYPHDPVWHNWAEFASHNQAWREALAALGDERYEQGRMHGILHAAGLTDQLCGRDTDTSGRRVRFVFLDVEPLTRARPDGHLNPSGPDCLHYCLPGVIDIWNLFLASFWMSCKR